MLNAFADSASAMCNMDSNTTHTTTILRPNFRDHPASRCQKRTSGLYGAREDLQRQTY